MEKKKLKEGLFETASRKAQRLAASQRVMTLGTCSSKGAWTAPVYYLFDSGSFYFFSSFDSRHITDARDTVLYVSASIFSDSPDARAIHGLQMEGMITGVKGMLKGGSIAVTYLTRFDIPWEGEKDPLGFIRKRFRAKLYRFLPETILFMDNSIEFGFRERVAL